MSLAGFTSNPEESFEINKADLSYERLDGETIVISLTEGLYYSFSGSASDIWWLLQEGYSISGIIEVMADVFHIPPSEIDRQTIEKFVELALERGLIRRAGRQSFLPRQLPNDYVRHTWTPPNFTEFSDLKDLILVDPIHDTSSLGWPIVLDE